MLGREVGPYSSFEPRLVGEARSGVHALLRSLGARSMVITGPRKRMPRVASGPTPEGLSPSRNPEGLHASGYRLAMTTRVRWPPRKANVMSSTAKHTHAACGMFQDMLYPCSHAAGVIMRTNQGKERHQARLVDRTGCPPCTLWGASRRLMPERVPLVGHWRP